MRFVLLILALLAASAGRQALAKELRGPEAGVVPFGMGRAYCAVADDWLALHYNPAGLAQVRSVDLQVFDLKLGANSQVVNASSDIKKLSDKDLTTAEKANQILGKTIKGQVNNTTQLTVPYFAIAAVYDLQVDVDLQNQQYPYTDLRLVKDFGIVAGTGVGFGKGKSFRLGMAMKFINRTGGSARLDISEISSAQTSLLDRFSITGSGVGLTAGMQHTLHLKNRTEFSSGITWHDIGNTSFGDANQVSRPERIDQNIIAGVALRLPIGGKVDRRKARRYGEGRSPNHLTLAFDYSHLNKSWDQVQLPRHFHYGLNLDLPIFSIQVGANQNALTYGAGIDLFGLKFSGASYAEEMGSFAGQKRDRRYLLSISGSLGVGKF